jgi:TPR repeat protein
VFPRRIHFKDKAVSANSSGYDEALAEMHKENPNLLKSLHLLEAADTAGDARATYALATWYLHGQPPVLRQDRKKAVSLLERAAEAGVADALYDLGVSYEKGEVDEPDHRRAFENYLKAALRGEVQSIYEVGRCYYYGIGVTADQQIADIWIKRADELGVS